jgi:hypothetical protein
VTALATVVGIAIILVTLRDVVHELFHPDEQGSISHAVMRGTWRVLRRIGAHTRGALYAAGPVMLIAVAVTWTSALVVGWALIYLPRLPAAFHVADGVPAAASRGLTTALYLSLVSLTSLSSSDITPITGAMRLALAVESLVGLVLITAWITWVLSIYQVLATRRVLTRELEHLRRAYPRPTALVADGEPQVGAELLRDVTEQVLRVCTDLEQSYVSYYFQPRQRSAALFMQLPYAMALAGIACDGGRDPVLRRHGVLLRSALDDMVCSLGRQFLGLEHASGDAVLHALCEDHLL